MAAGTHQIVPRRRGWVFDEAPAIWLAPLGVLLAAFYLWPALQVVRTSFTDANLMEPTARTTLDSYRDVLFYSGLNEIGKATLVFVGGSVVGQLSFGLLIALALDAGAKRKLPGVTFVRVAVLATWIIPGVASGITWQLIFSESRVGFLNGVLNAAGMRSIAWLSDPDIAIWSATLANIWRGTALSMILLYAGLQLIPGSLYEAAAIDGAGRFQAFRYITLPQLKPILLINVILVTIFSLNTFDLVLPLTGGGPGRSTEVLALAVYNTVFHDFNLGEGSVLAVMMLLIGLGMTAGYARLLR